MTFDQIKLESIDIKDINSKFYTVLSVELGNTTIKSIITTTNIKNNKSYQLIKLVRLTRNIRRPKTDEDIFGHTIWDKPLSKEAIEDEISSIILESLSKTSLTVDDLDFVVRSTGVVAISSLSHEIDVIIKALSDGCLNAGIKVSQMTAPFSLNNIPEHIRKHSFFNNIQFDGSVVSVKAPNTSGIAANEMEGELVTAGIKLASKMSSIDYRNPVISIDMGTTLAGQIIDDKKPYANMICNFVGLAGGIMDVILRGSDIINENESTIDVDFNENSHDLNMQLIHENTIKLHQFIDVMQVPKDVDEFGHVAVYQQHNSDTNVTLIGSQINNQEQIIETFSQLSRNYTKEELMIQVDDFYAYLIKRLIEKTIELGLFPQNAILGITGRSGITGNKPFLINSYLEDKVSQIIFVEDGLALGAVMMARCMNSLGNPIDPIGGSHKGICIMQQRIQLNNKN